MPWPEEEKDLGVNHEGHGRMRKRSPEAERKEKMADMKVGMQRMRPEGISGAQ